LSTLLFFFLSLLDIEKQHGTIVDARQTAWPKFSRNILLTLIAKQQEAPEAP
jgi:hypothetical protein